MVFLPNVGVNLRACLCGVVNYASAQAIDFLDLEQKSSFLDWKHQQVPIFGNEPLWMGTSLTRPGQLKRCEKPDLMMRLTNLNLGFNKSAEFQI